MSSTGITRSVSIAIGYSPEKVMKVFQDSPAKVFPFTVEACSKFTAGAECFLKTGAPTTNPNGWVGVDVTPTSTKFTVISEGYFDGPGSTIEFSTYEDDGVVHVKRQAEGHGADLPTFIGIGILHANEGPWDEQADNLRGLLGVSAPK